MPATINLPAAQARLRPAAQLAAPQKQLAIHLAKSLRPKRSQSPKSAAGTVAVTKISRKI